MQRNAVSPDQFQGSELDHLNLPVADIEASARFYTQALNAIGIVKVFDIPPQPDGRSRVVGFGYEHKPFFWLIQGQALTSDVHIAFRVNSRNLVRRFFEAALEAGGRVKLEPGLRPEYHEHYYGAFIHGPDGENVEAVCHLDDEDAVALVEQVGHAQEHLS